MQFIPSILEKDRIILLNQLKNLLPYFRYFQIDVSDGLFVPNRTVQVEDIRITIEQLNNLTISQSAFDFHLMVKDYEAEIKKLMRLGNLLKLGNIFIHFSLSPNLQLLSSIFQLSKIGLVLNPEDSIEQLTINYQLSTIPFIQIMSVNPGFQGSEFIPETLKKIRRLREIGYKKPVYLDGGINSQTLPQIMKFDSKPDFLVVGSYLNKTGLLAEKIKLLKDLSVG